VERHQPVTPVSRRSFLSAALVGLIPKRGRRIEGGFVFESAERGHRLRDGGGFPQPAESRRAPIVIVGGGIAGLSAAWRLHTRGMRDFVVLEMESLPGGNARWGGDDEGGTVYPWGAHYVPVPGRSAGLVRELFSDLGVFDGTAWDERYLVHAPKERLFIHGRWQDGLEPLVGPTRRDRDQMSRFHDRVSELGASGRFSVPAAAAGDPGSPAEDALSMSAWLDREGLDSPWLRWMVDYACRDDYGALSADVSAWAGLHYFAARDTEDQGPLTWPEGNGWIVRRLLERLGPRVLTDQLTYRIERHGRDWHVLTPATRWTAEIVIVAAPLLVAARIVEGAPSVDVTYSPWFVANVTLDRSPGERGPGAAWDNVIFDSRSLGYVVATHQHLRQHLPRTVWTCYWALAYQAPAAARRWLLAQSWPALRDQVLGDLARAHPDIGDGVARVDILRLGHAMVRPTPGFLGSPARRAFQAHADRLLYAHSDLSGLPLFEEAQYHGVRAAEQALDALSKG
jgi:glycine/D-amino acid oxidase-like deaminating enzyme